MTSRETCLDSYSEKLSVPGLDKGFQDPAHKQHSQTPTEQVPAVAQKLEGSSEDDLILTPKAASFFLRHFFGECTYLALALLTGGLSMIFLSWHLKALVKLRYKETKDADPFAELVLITSLDDTLDLVPIFTYQGNTRTGSPWVQNRPKVARHGQLRMFVWRQER